MKRYFLTGLVLLLPITLTIIIVTFLFNLLTAPFVGVVQDILSHYNLFSEGIGILTAEQVQILISKILIFTTIFLSIVFLGFITQVVFVHYVIRFWDYLLHRIPIFRTIYRASQEVITTLFRSDASSFKQVVLVPYPSHANKCIGLVTRDPIKGLPEQIKGDNVLVFVPTSPNPTAGFLMIFQRSDLIFLDMKVDDAMKYVISCGVISPQFKEHSK